MIQMLKMQVQETKVVLNTFHPYSTPPTSYQTQKTIILSIVSLSGISQSLALEYQHILNSPNNLTWFFRRILQLKSFGLCSELDSLCLMFPNVTQEITAQSTFKSAFDSKPSNCNRRKTVTTANLILCYKTYCTDKQHN